LRDFVTIARESPNMESATPKVRPAQSGDVFMTNLKSVTLASAAALFAMAAVATAPATAAPAAGTVHCYGVNACKGQSDCKSGNHACKGQNSCKGQGFKDMSASACTTAGGKTTP
jgi:uncharacterized membrane protein